MRSINRAEQAWKRLEAWARNWHQPNAPYFAGTLGGAPQAQVYFGGVRAEFVAKLLEDLDVEFLVVSRSNGPNEASALAVGEVLNFLAAPSCKTDCYIVARVKPTLGEGAFESHLFIEKVDQRVEAMITWVPLLAFLQISDLKARFLQIFDWFFSVQHSLKAEKVLLCLERCPPPSTDPLPWIEI